MVRSFPLNVTNTSECYEHKLVGLDKWAVGEEKEQKHPGAIARWVWSAKYEL
jgi:hypothetical protein